jgi:hypothetical protein
MSQVTSRFSPPARNAAPARRIAAGMAFAIVAALAIIGLPQAGHAQAAKKPTPGLEGAWSGGGSVMFASGAKEQARCRAQYRRAGTTSYTLNATCATASGRAAQTATLRRVSDNKYRGNFYNSEYGITGVIHVIVSGSSQTVRLISDSGSALFRLNR